MIVRPGSLVFGLAFALCQGCSGPSLRGALALEDSRDFSQAARAELVPSDCRDARGAPADPPRLRVQRVALAGSGEALLELRPGYDAVVVTNAHDEARGRVFQYVSNDGRRGELLHTLLLTPMVPGPRLTLSDTFSAEGSGANFRATFESSILSCALVFAKSEPRAGSR